MTQVEILWKAIVLSFIISHLFVATTFGSTLPKAEALFEDNIAMESNDDISLSYEDEEFEPKFTQSKTVFNQGKPFFVEKDPVSGQLDFNHKKSAGVVDTYKTSTDELIPLRTNEISPNIHDFLHLPVKYSSSKSVYPLVSSSYANLKYQGNNKNYISNHKDYSGNDTEKGPTIYKTSGNKYPFEKSPERPRITTTTTQRTTTTTPTSTSTFYSPTFSTTRPTPSTFPTSTLSSSRYTTPRTSSVLTTSSLPPTQSSTTESIRFDSRPTLPFKFRRPSTTTTSTTVRPSLAFPTENAVSFVDMLNSFSDEQQTNSIQGNLITDTMVPGFQKPSGFKLSHPGTTIPTPSSNPEQNNQGPFKASASSPDLSQNGQFKAPNQGSSIDLNQQGQFKAPNQGSPSDFNQQGPFKAPSQGFTQDFNQQGSFKAPNQGSSPDFNHQGQFKPSNQGSSPDLNQQGQFKAPNQGSSSDLNQHVQFNYPSSSFANQPVSSMNNIKISPEQNIASFVLGSKQSVALNGQKETFNQVPPKVVGQVFNEPISSSVSIRFPSKEEENERFKDIPVITGTYNNLNQMPNGHSAPVSQGQKNVLFPPPSNSNLGNFEHDSKLVGTKIVFESNDQVSDDSAPQPTHEVLPLNSNPNQRPIADNYNPGFSPPQPPKSQPSFNGHFTRPPPYFKHDNQNRGPPPPHRQMIATKLPNILPQFRPNAKSSHGHYNKDVGVHRLPPQDPYRNYPRRPSHPMMNNNRRVYNQNRPNNYPPTQFMNKMAPAPPPSPSAEKIEASRRVFKIPNSNSYQTQALYASQPNRLPPAQQAPHNYGPVRNLNNNMDHPMPEYNQEGAIDHNNKAVGSDIYTMPPPQPTIIDRDVTLKLEPVVTLQMLQTKKTHPGPPSVSTKETFLEEKDNQPGASDNPVYVVYPVKQTGSISRQDEELRDPVVVGQRGDEAPLPPTEIGSGYQNTPFYSIHSNREQKPLLTTLQKHLSVPKPAKTNFPYNLEQPGVDVASELDLSPHRKPLPQSQSLYNIGEQPASSSPNILPKILSPVGPFGKVTERPIAIAYTPKDTSFVQHLPHLHANQYSVPNVDANVIPEIRDADLQTEVSLILGDRRHEAIYPSNHYNQDFQAPFHPSMSVGASDVREGWSILKESQTQPDPYSINYKENGIDRNDDFSDEILDKKDEDDQTFDANQFNPVFEGGFKPIYPVGGDAPVSSGLTMAKKDENEEKANIEKHDEEKEDLKSKAAEVVQEIHSEEPMEIERQDPNQKIEKEELKEDEITEEVEEAVTEVTTMAGDQKVMSFEDALSAIFGFGDEESVTQSLDNNHNALQRHESDS